MTYYKKLDIESESYCYTEQTPLKIDLESKITKLLNRGLLKKKPKPVNKSKKFFIWIYNFRWISPKQLFKWRIRRW